MTQPSFTQVTFRGRNDDGSESGATWKDTQGNDWTQDTGVNFRIRFLIDETASRVWSLTFNLYYQINGGGYNAVTGSTPVQFSLSSNFADGDDCTSQLTGGSGTFLTNNNGMKETTGGAINSGGAGQYFDTEWCLKIDSAQVSDGDTINLRIYNGTAAIAVYTDTPVITVNIPQQNINETSTLAITNKQITSLSEVNITDVTSLAISNKIITSLSEVNIIDTTSLIVSDKTITSLSEINIGDITSLTKNKGLNAEHNLIIEETLYEV